MIHPIKALKSRLIDEWKQAWKLWSVQLNAAGLTLLAVAEIVREAVAFVPPALIHYVPAVQWLATAFFALGLAARLFRQKKDPGP